MNENLKALQNIINYQFQDEELLYSAVMHSSYANEMHLPKYKCNERLEFLGDAILDFLVGEFLYNKYFDIFVKISELQRKLFEFAFYNGWYVLESVSDTKLTEKLKLLTDEYVKLGSK